MAHGCLLLVGEALPGARTVDRYEVVGDPERIRQVDVAAPVDALGAVPLKILALLIEIQQFLPARRIVVVEDRVHRVARHAHRRMGQRLDVALHLHDGPPEGSRRAENIPIICRRLHPSVARARLRGYLSSMIEWVKEVTDATFDSEVIERSELVPVA